MQCWEERSADPRRAIREGLGWPSIIVSNCDKCLSIATGRKMYGRWLGVWLSEWRTEKKRDDVCCEVAMVWSSEVTFGAEPSQADVTMLQKQKEKRVYGETSSE
jgi:hypothetical protein